MVEFDLKLEEVEEQFAAKVVSECDLEINSNSSSSSNNGDSGATKADKEEDV